jgi:hypothetical protein
LQMVVQICHELLKQQPACMQNEVRHE